MYTCSRKTCVQIKTIAPYEEEIEAERIGKMNYITGQIIKFSPQINTRRKSPHDDDDNSYGQDN
jgi:hypothetical protein